MGRQPLGPPAGWPDGGIVLSSESVAISCTAECGVPYGTDLKHQRQPPTCIGCSLAPPTVTVTQPDLFKGEDLVAPYLLRPFPSANL